MDQPETSRRLCANVQSAHSYSNVAASGRSVVHNGDRISITYNFYQESNATRRSTDGTREGLFYSYIEDHSSVPKECIDHATSQDRPQQCLAVVLDSLKGYATSAQQSKTDENSPKISAQLAVILNIVRLTEHGKVTPSAVYHQIRNLLLQLARPSCVKINVARPRQRVTQFSRAESRMHKINFGHWQISLTTKIVKSWCVNGLSDIQTCSTLHVQPFRGGEGTRIAAFFSETSNIHHNTSLSPVILTYRQISNAAKVFQSVANDDLSSLERLLRTKEAYLRDCDDHGRSLLFVSTWCNITCERSSVLMTTVCLPPC